MYPDGSVFLHVELVAVQKDNYIPEERMLDPKLINAVPTTSLPTGPTPMEAETTPGTHILPNNEAINSNGTKRARVETANDDDEDLKNTQSTPTAMTMTTTARSQVLWLLLELRRLPVLRPKPMQLKLLVLDSPLLQPLQPLLPEAPLLLLPVTMHPYSLCVK